MALDEDELERRDSCCSKVMLKHPLAMMVVHSLILVAAAVGATLFFQQVYWNLQTVEKEHRITLLKNNYMAGNTCISDELELRCSTFVPKLYQMECDCDLDFNISQLHKGPVTLYYELDDFDQTNEPYASSKDERQLAGELGQWPALACGRFSRAGDGKPIYPCGELADSMFNDTFTLLIRTLDGLEPVPMEFTNLVTGDTAKYRNSPATDRSKFASPINWGRLNNGKRPWEAHVPYTDVENPHFQAWMNTSLRRKPYARLVPVGRYASGLPPGEYTFYIDIHYGVNRYNGSRTITLEVVTTAPAARDVIAAAACLAAACLLAILVTGLTYNIVSTVSNMRRAASCGPDEAAREEPLLQGVQGEGGREGVPLAHIPPRLATHTDAARHTSDSAQTNINLFGCVQAYLRKVFNMLLDKYKSYFNRGGRYFVESKKWFSCEICQQKFRELYILGGHKLLCHAKETLSCDECQQKFTEFNKLCEHKQLHDAKDTFSCEVCQQKFTEFNKLYEHKRLHDAKDTYSCEVCQQKFTEFNKLCEHKHLHDAKDTFSCEVCQQKFTDFNKLYEHKRLHDAKDTYSCEVCQQKFTEFNKLCEHKQLHDAKDTFSCEVCQQKFTEFNKICEHKQLHDAKDTYSCEVCQQKFTEFNKLCEHKHLHDAKDTYSCEVCQQKFTEFNKICEHKRLHDAKDTYSCEVCQQKFTEFHKLCEHKQLHDAKDTFSCEVCQQKFTEFNKLYEHKQLHDAKDTYSCEVCQLKFTEFNKLCEHKQLHDAKDTFSCEVCQQKFTEFNKLYEHKRLHDAKHTYSCEVCQQKFTEFNKLCEHKQLHDAKHTYSCEVCQQKFTEFNKLYEHKRLHDAKDTYSCEVCQQKFTEFNELSEHKRLHQSGKTSISGRDNRIIIYQKPRHLPRHRSWTRKRLDVPCIPGPSQEALDEPEWLYIKNLLTHKIGGISCQICTQIFGELDILHKLPHVTEETYLWGICEENFSEMNKLQKHQTGETLASSAETDSLTGKVLPQVSFQQFVHSHAPESRNLHLICVPSVSRPSRSIFDSVRDKMLKIYYEHVQREHRDQEILCQVCKQFFSVLHKLDKHQLLHDIKEKYFETNTIYNTFDPTGTMSAPVIIKGDWLKGKILPEVSSGQVERPGPPGAGAEAGVGAGAGARAEAGADTTDTCVLDLNDDSAVLGHPAIFDVMRERVLSFFYKHVQKKAHNVDEISNELYRQIIVELPRLTNFLVSTTSPLRQTRQIVMQLMNSLFKPEISNLSYKHAFLQIETDNVEKISCKICTQIFSVLDKIEKHRLHHDADKIKKTCQICQQNFCELSQLKQHVLMYSLNSTCKQVIRENIKIIITLLTQIRNRKNSKCAGKWKDYQEKLTDLSYAMKHNRDRMFILCPEKCGTFMGTVEIMNHIQMHALQARCCDCVNTGSQCKKCIMMVCEPYRREQELLHAAEQHGEAGTSRGRGPDESCTGEASQESDDLSDWSGSSSEE